jgi:tetratricopeptide (TPR) repeat protein
MIERSVNDLSSFRVMLAQITHTTAGSFHTFQSTKGSVHMIFVHPLMGVVAAVALAFVPVSASADFGPKPKVDCKKKENKNKPACKPSNGASTDEVFNAAYWMAKQGQYDAALRVLALAPDQNDPRILNATGLATRKSGNVEAAIPFYARALAIDPNYVLAREYLGEAYLSQGDLASAQDQLSEIGARCGTACTAYTHLAQHITNYKNAVKQAG